MQHRMLLGTYNTMQVHMWRWQPPRDLFFSFAFQLPHPTANAKKKNTHLQSFISRYWSLQIETCGA